MTVRVTETDGVHCVRDDDGLEVHFSDSKDSDAVGVTMFAPTPEQLALAATLLFDEYGADDFTQPELCSDGKWGCFGYIWRTRKQTRFDL